jgi:hypothetical protein
MYRYTVHLYCFVVILCTVEAMSNRTSTRECRNACFAAGQKENARASAGIIAADG